MRPIFLLILVSSWRFFVVTLFLPNSFFFQFSVRLSVFAVFLFRCLYSSSLPLRLPWGWVPWDEKQPAKQTIPSLALSALISPSILYLLKYLRSTRKLLEKNHHSTFSRWLSECLFLRFNHNQVSADLNFPHSILTLLLFSASPIPPSQLKNSISQHFYMHCLRDESCSEGISPQCEP